MNNKKKKFTCQSIKKETFLVKPNGDIQLGCMVLTNISSIKNLAKKIEEKKQEMQERIDNNYKNQRSKCSKCCDFIIE